MKSFEGHALPGSYFLGLGLLWCVKHPIKHFMQKENKIFSANKYFQCLEVLEAVAKTSLSLIGFFAGQFIPGGPCLHLYNKNGNSWVNLLAWTHGTMYLAYGLSGIAEVLSALHLKVLPGLDHFMLSQAMFIQGLLFYFHGHDRLALDQHVHLLMLLPIFGGAFCSLFEVFLRNRPILELLKTSMFLLQGSWFWQIGFVLYPPWGGPGWDQSDHENIMFITMCFCWHYMAILLLVTLSYPTTYWCIKIWKKCIRLQDTERLKFVRSSYTLLLRATDQEGDGSKQPFLHS
ncbi:transmembrane protein 45B-like [Struthio camelus]|uniref:transmembrane protein 45B-like n=1 Tax=Struthio camelus TaxID=8801 RepID=UPI00051E3E07|nr:PREDICTED: transmembrane protein 45B-like [Struthio camelus australis]